MFELCCKMRIVHLYCYIIGHFYYFLPATASPWNVVLSHDGPVVQGGTITFRADLYKYNQVPSGTFYYEWRDNAIPAHFYTTEVTTNTTTYWSLSYSADEYPVGSYEAEIKVHSKYILPWIVVTSERIEFEITSLLNGNITISQSNATVLNTYVSSATETKLSVSLREGDNDYISKNATSIATYWFIDCKYYGQTNGYTLFYNFTNPDVSHNIEALVIASFEPPVTTTALPPTTTPLPTTVAPNSTTPSTNVTTTVPPTSTVSPSNKTKTTETVESTTAVDKTILNINDTGAGNLSFPFICLNSSIIPPDPKKVYGYFKRQIDVRAPISNIMVEGTNWIQPWDMLNLNVTCKASGSISKCLQYHRGVYNVTGNETCNDPTHLQSCNFSIVHYFLEPSVYTILVILKNDVSQQIYPLTINIYKVTTKPQLSVIVVPVSCSLAAVVLIIFGVAYYMQSRARFTVEVADFDFGGKNPEMEYKTFKERLRDSFNNALRPGSERINVRSPYYGSMNN